LSCGWPRHGWCASPTATETWDGDRPAPRRCGPVNPSTIMDQQHVRRPASSRCRPETSGHLTCFR
jgi:hypothetical protein